MDSEFLSRMHSFQLFEEEKKGPQLELKDVQFRMAECQRSLVGQTHGDKATNFTGLKNMLSSLWAFIAPFKIKETGFNRFHFVFFSQQDKLKILNDKAWTFDSQFLILRPWVENMVSLNYSLHKVQLWIRVWNLPPQWISKETGLRLNQIFCNVFDVIIPENGSKQGWFLKILAEIDLNKPLLRGTKLRLQIKRSGPNSNMKTWHPSASTVG